MKLATFSLFAVCLVLAACDKPTEPTPTAIIQQPEISWFNGTVDQAFSLANKDQKPVFLYWGAVWCPPCQEIKHTVFKSSEFIALSKLFIPVYLDGDTPLAQAMGERFGVKGYPTMIVFNAAGNEITRIPGGIDISQYNTILALSLDQVRPTADLIQAAMTNPESLSRRDFAQLAYYSWGQDFNARPADAPTDLLRTIAELAAPVDQTAAARLFLQYLVESKQAWSEDDALKIEGAEPWLNKILDDNTLTLACWDYIAYWPEVLDVLSLSESEKARLASKWQDHVFNLRHNEQLSTAEQLAGWLPALYYHFEKSETALPSETVDLLVADMAQADQKTRNAFARQSVISQMDYIYQQAHMVDKARALLLAELDKSASPYYFMSGLGAIDEDAGNTRQAINWYKRAYETSTGSATRFQWGASYVRALVRLAPQENALIASTAERLLTEFASGNELSTGRNFRVLRSLKSQLGKWKTENPEGALSPFDLRLAALCQEQAEDQTARQNCQSLLSQDSTT